MSTTYLSHLRSSDTKTLSLRRIRHFVVLAETLNFHRAAEALHMTQPPLTVSIKKLEAELGITLFVREPKGISLTHEGEAVLVEARKLLFHSNQLLQTAKHTASGTGGTLRIGFVGTATYGMLQKILPLFRAQYPGVELVLQEKTSVDILDNLANKTLDVGLVRVPLLKESSATLLELERDEYIAALPRGSVLAKKDTLSLADMANESFIMYTPTQANGLFTVAMLACQQAGFLPHVTQEAIQVQTVLALVESGLGVALVPSTMKRYVSDNIVYRHFKDFPSITSIGLALAYMAGTESAAAKRFREMVCNAFN